MELKQSIGTRYLFHIFEFRKGTLSKIIFCKGLVPNQKNKYLMFDSEISKENELLEIFNIKRRCNSFVASHDIKNIGTHYQQNFTKGFPSLLIKSKKVPGTNSGKVIL